MLRCKIQDISSNEIFKMMNWIPFQDRASYKCCLIFKVKNNLVPSDMQTFTPVSVVHDHNTRPAARGDIYVSSANIYIYTD